MNEMLMSTTELRANSSTLIDQKVATKSLLSERRIFIALVVLSFPIFVLVAVERRMAGTFNKDISGNRQGLLKDAKEYATSTIALAFQSQ
jgi:hypothetical protein